MQDTKCLIGKMIKMEDVVPKMLASELKMLEFFRNHYSQKEFDARKADIESFKLPDDNNSRPTPEEVATECDLSFERIRVFYDFLAMMSTCDYWPARLNITVDITGKIVDADWG